MLEVAIAARVEPMFRSDPVADTSECVSKLGDKASGIVTCALDFVIKLDAPRLGVRDDRGGNVLLGLCLRESSRRLRTLFEHELISCLAQRGGGSAEWLTGTCTSGGGFDVFAFEFVNERLRASDRLARLAGFVAQRFRLVNRLTDFGRLREFGNEIERDSCHQPL
jgi:hypothetical protein